MERKRITDKMKYLENPKLILLLRVILGIIFIYASIDKIIDPLKFSNTIDNYHITPVSLNNLAALIIPWVELIVGLFLIAGVYLRGSLIIVMVLLVWFIFILTQALVRGINVNCGCFNLAEQVNDVNLRANMIKRIIEDVIFLLMAFLVKRNSN